MKINYEFVCFFFLCKKQAQKTEKKEENKEDYNFKEDIIETFN